MCTEALRWTRFCIAGLKRIISRMSNNEEIEQVGPSEEAEPTPKEVVEEEEKKEKEAKKRKPKTKQAVVLDPKQINVKQVRRLQSREKQTPFLVEKQGILEKRIDLCKVKLLRAESELTQVKAALSNEELPVQKRKSSSKSDEEGAPKKRRKVAPKVVSDASTSESSSEEQPQTQASASSEEQPQASEEA